MSIEELKRATEKQRSVFKLMDTHPGLKAFKAFDQDQTPFTYSLAERMVDGEDIMEALEYHAEIALGGLECYLDSMSVLANNLDSFREYCVKINPDYEKKFAMLGEIWGISTLLDSTADLCKDAIEERRASEKEWFESHK